MARKFFYVCAGMLMLALSYHFGTSSANAQSPSNSVVAVNAGGTLVYTANGDVFEGSNLSGSVPLNWSLRVNIFSGLPTPAVHESWGQLKARYR